MKKIAVTGGKGGVGKSTVAILLANKFIKENKKVVLCDCDVECPNDYLLLGEKPGKIEGRITAEFPELDQKKCEKCGLCVKACRNNAIFQSPNKFPVFVKDLCSGCGACWMVCPKKAITPKKEETGKIYLNKLQILGNKLQDLWLITGSAKPRLEETGPVVIKTKEFALNLAKKVGADVVLFDTAAGTHCPVISALLDCDLAYAVTEPTPMGSNDLGLILDLCRKLKIPTKIILNQADLGDKTGIKKIAKDYKAKIQEEIPYSKRIVEAYSRGDLLNIQLKDIL